MLWFRRHVLRRRMSADGRSERGATIVEYGLIVALFAMGMFGVVRALQSSMTANYSASESRVGAPQTVMAAPSITIDYSVVGTCAANGGQFYDALSGTCDTTRAGCGAGEWPDPTTQTCVTSKKSECNDASNGWLISNNTCETCTMDQPYDSGTGTCNATSTNCSGGRVFDGSSCVITSPGTPTGLSATPGDAQVTLGWTAPASNGGSVITGYLVECKKSTDTSWTLSSTVATTSKTFNGLTNGTSYVCQVTAQNSVGGGTAATFAGFTPAKVPSAPTGVSGSNTGLSPGQLKVSWTAVTGTNTGGSAITGYKVCYSKTKTPSPYATCGTAAASATSLTLGGLTANTTYYFYVVATNGVGDGPASSTANAKSK